MSAETATFSMEESKAYRAILWGGLTAGIMDITAAFVSSGIQGRSPIWVLQSIATGLLGRDSYTGGVAAAALGLAVQFLIAFTAATVFYAASRRLTFLIHRPVVSGLLYGITVWLFMYLVVLPVTFHRSFIRPLSAVAIGLMIHMLCVGLPISLVVSRYSTRPEKE
jgi:asparagine N-glycosylation enzyme membrane subunit Stt3